jgi:hypothetical protein
LLFFIFKKSPSKKMFDKFSEIANRLKLQNLKGVFFMFIKDNVLVCTS